MNRLACLLAPALWLLVPACVNNTEIARVDASADASDVVAPDARPDAVDADALDAGSACPANPVTAVGTACAEEGRTCGTCPSDPCLFCNLLRCQGGHWQMVESIPDPRCADAGDAGDAADAPDAPADADTCAMPLTSIGSRQTVHFSFPAGASGYIVTGGMFCGGMRLERIEAGTPTSIPMGLPFECICECAPPPPPSYTTAHALAGTDSFVFNWDARAMATCMHTVDCAMRGWPGVPPASETLGVLVPVPSGHYRATFGVVDTLPSRCTAGTDGAVNCSPALPMGPGGLGPYDLCPGAREVQVEFDVPPSGDVNVSVPLT